MLPGCNCTLGRLEAPGEASGRSWLVVLFAVTFLPKLPFHSRPDLCAVTVGRELGVVLDIPRQPEASFGTLLYLSDALEFHQSNYVRTRGTSQG